MTCTGWREVEPRIDWFLAPANYPTQRGMCAQHTWHALGGDKGCPPAWGCPDANACVDKVRASGRFWTPQTWDGPPPRGAWVGWKYGENGHAAISLGDGRIATTDPNSGKMTGVEQLDYPKKWGFSTKDGPYSVWTDQYAGVRFTVGEEEDDVALSDEDIQKIVDKVWAKRIADPTNGDEPTAATMVGRSVTLARQSRDAARVAVEQTVPCASTPSAAFMASPSAAALQAQVRSGEKPLWFIFASIVAVFALWLLGVVFGVDMTPSESVEPVPAVTESP